ncbi:MAG: UDP-N-acetylmuramate--L-alanine ligase [Streptosporangiales bacterium]|nr:UDP-N-acetylmuramate--L-alanine ligase [Streptosporangiales bacterium]
MGLVEAVELVPAEQLGRVHFVGIGGAGMSGIARILLARGMTVSGCDAKQSRVLSALQALGADVHVGHEPGHVADVDTLVVSTAIRPDHPELVAAQQSGVRVLPRAAALASVMAGYRGVAVAGTHGKTTTTSLVTVALQRCAADPSFAIGGELNESGANAHAGSGDIFVAEVDESDGSFLMLSPHAAIVTNVEADHLDNYGTEAAYREAFVQFLDRVEDGGFVVVCADDPGSAELGALAGERGMDVRTYGFADGADLRVTDLRSRGMGSTFEVVHGGRRLGPVDLGVPGRHNVLNSCAALLVGLGLGFPFAELREGLAGYTGTRRRFEQKGTADGVRVFDSYAHHPTEIAADLAAAKDVAGEGRIVACFQPHLYSRTRLFADEFAAALSAADEVVVMEIYAAREDPEPGVTGQLVSDRIDLPAERVTFEPSWSAVPALLADRAGPGDIVLTIGAGDVTMIGPEVLDLLQTRDATA